MGIKNPLARFSNFFRHLWLHGLSGAHTYLQVDYRDDGINCYTTLCCMDCGKRLVCKAINPVLMRFYHSRFIKSVNSMQEFA